MALTETNYKSRLIAYKDHANTPQDVKDLIQRELDGDPTYYAQETVNNDRVDRYMNSAAASLDTAGMTETIKYVKRNRDTIDD